MIGMHYSLAACQPVSGSLRQNGEQAQEKLKTEGFPHED
jgi:hypothetical protein